MLRWGLCPLGRERGTKWTYDSTVGRHMAPRGTALFFFGWHARPPSERIFRIQRGRIAVLGNFWSFSTSLDHMPHNLFLSGTIHPSVIAQTRDEPRAARVVVSELVRTR